MERTLPVSLKLGVSLHHDRPEAVDKLDIRAAGGYAWVADVSTIQGGGGRRTADAVLQDA
jgi:hypothetical protein